MSPKEGSKVHDVSSRRNPPYRKLIWPTVVDSTKKSHNPRLADHEINLIVLCYFFATLNKFIPLFSLFPQVNELANAASAATGGKSAGKNTVRSAALLAALGIGLSSFSMKQMVTKQPKRKY